MKFFTYAALVLGVSAISLNQKTYNRDEDQDLAEVYYPEAESFMAVANDTAADGTGDDEGPDEDEMKKMITDFMKKNKKITIHNIR